MVGCQENLSVNEKTYYIRKKDKLLKDFDGLSPIVEMILLKSFDSSTVNRWKAKAREEYVQIIPQIPYVGGDESDYTRLLILASGFIPFLKILREKGVTTRQNGKMIFDAATFYFNNKIIKPIRWVLGWYTLSSFKQKAIKKIAERTQLRKYKGDWLMEFVEGEKGDFEFGVNYRECGLVKFYTEQGIQEFVPYLCITDYALFSVLGIELKRTQSIANGGSHCNFRFVKRGKGPIGWPPESLPEWTGKFEI